MKALISVPDTVDICELVECIAASGSDIVCTPETTTRLRNAGIQCASTGADLQRIYISTFDMVIIGLPDLASQPYPDVVDEFDAQKCALLVLSACRFSSIATVSHQSQYRDVISELRKFRNISPEMRERLAAKAFYVASEWTNQVGRFRRKRSEPTMALA